MKGIWIGLELMLHTIDFLGCLPLTTISYSSKRCFNPHRMLVTKHKRVGKVNTARVCNPQDNASRCWPLGARLLRYHYKILHDPYKHIFGTTEHHWRGVVAI